MAITVVKTMDIIAMMVVIATIMRIPTNMLVDTEIIMVHYPRNKISNKPVFHITIVFSTGYRQAEMNNPMAPPMPEQRPGPMNIPSIMNAVSPDQQIPPMFSPFSNPVNCTLLHPLQHNEKNKY